jgi:hypothetical protein
MVDRKHLHWRSCHNLLAAYGSVGLGDYRKHRMAGSGEMLQNRDGELRRTHEDQVHKAFLGDGQRVGPGDLLDCGNRGQVAIPTRPA